MLLAGLTAENLRDDGFVDAEDLLSRFECNDLGGATKDFEQALALLGEAGHKGRKLEAAKWRTGPGFRLSPASCVAKGSPMPRR